MRAATDEWAGASAYSGYIFWAIETGNVFESAYLQRTPDGTSTTHDLPMGDDLVAGALFTGPAANTYKRVQIPAKDGNYEFDSDIGILGQALYNLFTATAAADDDVDYQLVVGIASVPFDDREAHIELTTTGAIVGFFYNVKATHSPAPDAPVTVTSRGEAPSSTTVQTISQPAQALRTTPPTGLLSRSLR